MCEIKSFAVVIMVHAMVMCITCQIQCSTDYVYGSSGDLQETTYEWHAAKNGTHTSTPLCLDANYNIIRRSCRDDSWYPKYVDNCYNFECPRRFLRVAAKDKCSYQVPRGSTCPELSSILAELETGPGSDPVAIEDSKLCFYGTEEFLNVAEKITNRIFVQFAFLKKLHITVNIPEVMETVHGKSIYCYSSNVNLLLRTNRKSVGLRQLYRSNYPTANYAIFEVNIEDDPAEYWCQVYEIGRARPVTTGKVVAHGKKKSGNEYTLLAEHQGRNGLDLIAQVCAACRLMGVSSSGKSAQYLLHLTEALADDVAAQYSTLKEDLEARVAASTSKMKITFKSSDFCLPHEGSLSWKLTPIGSMGFPSKMCLDSKGQPIGRKCGGDFLYGAEWEPETPCFEKKPLPDVTKLLTEVTTRTDVDFKNLSDVVNAPHEFSSLDLALIAEGYERTHVTSPPDFLRSMSKVMSLSQKVLETSEKYYNTTDKLLEIIGKVLIENPSSIKPMMEENLDVVILKPFKDDAVGVAFYKHNNVRQILKGQTMADLPSENLEAVVVTPPGLLEALSKDMSPEKKEEFEIIVTSFKNNVKGGRIINVAIPDFKTYWMAPSDSFLRLPEPDIDYAFWDYRRKVFNTESIRSPFGHTIVDKIYQAVIINGDLSLPRNSYLVATCVTLLIFTYLGI